MFMSGVLFCSLPIQLLYCKFHLNCYYLNSSSVCYFFESLILSVAHRVSYETSFDLKQPKLEPKLVSTLSETRCLFRLFRFYFETASFGISIEPKQNRNNRNKPKKVNLVAEYCTFTS
jgi:hypothetical protein